MRYSNLRNTSFPQPFLLRQKKIESILTLSNQRGFKKANFLHMKLNHKCIFARLMDQH